MTCRTETVIAGQSLTHVIRAFCLDIYDLVSTTVSGIPMKVRFVEYMIQLLFRKKLNKELP